MNIYQDYFNIVDKKYEAFGVSDYLYLIKQTGWLRKGGEATKMRYQGTSQKND